MGLNFHLQSRVDPLDKKIELEILYKDLQHLARNNKVVIDPDLKEQLLAESTRIRHRGSSLLCPAQRQTAKALKGNDDIVIRRADKSAVYVILDKNDYMDKLNALLGDGTKFLRITADPTAKLKVAINSIIRALKAVQGQENIPLIVGEYKPGYVYGNVQIHKPGNPLRPIISQVPTATYSLAKQLNRLILPYLPSRFALQSTDNFLEVLKTTTPDGEIAFLDVESLFSNVPVEETIEIIVENAYNHPTLSAPKMPAATLHRLLKACTTEAPFRAPDGQLYYQIEGVAMGSPLGPTFANYYMTHIENQVLEDPEIRPHTYCRYVDDIYLVVRNEQHLLDLKSRMEAASVLSFTYEMSDDDDAIG